MVFGAFGLLGMALFCWIQDLKSWAVVLLLVGLALGALDLYPFLVETGADTGL